MPAARANGPTAMIAHAELPIKAFVTTLQHDYWCGAWWAGPLINGAWLEPDAGPDSEVDRYSDTCPMG